MTVFQAVIVVVRVQYENLVILMIYSYFLCQNLRKMEGETQEPVKDLNELQNADWVRASTSPCQARVCNHSIYLGNSCVIFVPTRPGSGCRWCEIYEMVWSWRRFRNVSTTHCPPNTSSHLMKCWWTTSVRNATSCEKSWWGFLYLTYTKTI